jgi:hypothetical protein
LAAQILSALEMGHPDDVPKENLAVLKEVFAKFVRPEKPGEKTALVLAGGGGKKADADMPRYKKKAPGARATSSALSSAPDKSTDADLVSFAADFNADQTAGAGSKVVSAHGKSRALLISHVRQRRRFLSSH